MSRWIYRSLYLSCILIVYVSADWPSTQTFPIQLLGLFPDPENTSRPNLNSLHARAMFKAAILLAHEYNMTIGGQSVGWQVVQTGGKIVNATRKSCLHISTSNVVGIVGPQLSRESRIIAPFAKTLEIPMISYGATDPALSDRNKYPAFFRTIPSDAGAAQAIVRLFIKYAWKSCVIIYQNDAFGSGGAKAIGDAFYYNNLTIVQDVIFDITTQTIRGDLKSILRSSSTRIVVVWAQTTYTELILHKALENNILGPQFIWILSNSITLSRFNQSSYNQLVGLLTLQAVVAGDINAAMNRTLLNDAYKLWQKYEPESFPGSQNVDYYALFAFDATWALIGALQDFCSMTIDPSSSSPCLSFTNTSFCFDRQLLNSSSLFSILRTRTFLGVSGIVEFNSDDMDQANGTYYIVKNIQLFLSGLSYVSVLAWSKSSDWISFPDRETNVIVWPGHSLDRPSDSASLLGMTLRIAMVQSEPYTSITYLTDQSGKKTSRLSGYMPDLLDLLRAQMGFNSTITVLPSNQSYSELVDWVMNGVYDVVVTDLTITAARREKVAFSSSIFDNSLRIIIRQAPSNDVDLVSYLKPFSWTVWLTLLCATIYAGLVFCLLERRQNRELQNRSIPSLIALSMWYAIGIILGYGADFQVTTAPGRVLTLGLYILCLISVAAYTANLASDLTISNTRYLIDDINDLRNGKIPSNRIGILVDTAIEDFYLREISNGVRNFHSLTSKEQIYESLLSNTIDASIMDGGLLEYITGSVYCNLTLVGADFDRSSFGIAYQKGWQYAVQFDATLLSLRESRALDDLKTRWFQTSNCAGLSVETSALRIESMTGLFVTFLLIIILAMGLFLWTKRFRLRDLLLIVIYSMRLLINGKSCYK